MGMANDQDPDERRERRLDARMEYGHLVTAYLALANMMWLGFGRVAPSKAHRSAENIAYDYDSFSKTLGQWINSSGHRENLLMHGATKVGVASAKSRTTGRTYWAMVIAGDYERFRSPSPKSTRSNHDERTCRLEFVGLCLPADLSK